MTEVVTAKKSKGEVLVFRRGYKPSQFKESKADMESGTPNSSGTSAIATKMEDGNTSDKESGLIQKQTSVFHWRFVNYLLLSLRAYMTDTNLQAMCVMM